MTRRCRVAFLAAAAALILHSLALSAPVPHASSQPGTDLAAQARAALDKASHYYHDALSSHGGYVYYYSLDLKQRWGEGWAGRNTIWVQPPGTPTVGMAFLKAYEATGDSFYLNAATEAAEALAAGQLPTGGWSNRIDFSDSTPKARAFSEGVTSFDDGQTQGATQLLVLTDKALNFKNKRIHDSALRALDMFLAAQFPNGAFPQVWMGPHENPPILKASYPEYDWRTEGRIKAYWFQYTINDNVMGTAAETLMDAYRVYKDPRYLEAVKKIGDFYILAQMPDPQPAWAQQYSFQMKPIWARRFEPPCVSGHESQEVMESLLSICRFTGERKYLEPIPRALAYLRASTLPDGTLARMYELQTNKPLYVKETGHAAELSYNREDAPKHYSWNEKSRLSEIEARYNMLMIGEGAVADPLPLELEPRVRQILADMDDQGRWIEVYQGDLIVGQPDWRKGFPHLSSELFSRNIELLSQYLIAAKSR